MRITGYLGLPTASIADGATTPVPPEGAGAMVWSPLAGTLTWNGSSWAAGSVPAGGGITGKTLVSFGAAPGGDDTNQYIVDTGVTAGSVVNAWIIAEATGDHSADEHRIENLKIVAGDIEPGAGFIIYATATNGRVYGDWSVGWSRS